MAARAFRDYPVAVELRHRSWSDDATDTREPARRASMPRWAQIDEPKFKSSIRQNLAAERPHASITCACTAGTPRSGGSTRSPRIATTICTRPRSCSRSRRRQRQRARAVKKAYLYANNHFSAKSVANAAILKAQLGQELDGEYPAEFVDRYPGSEGHGQAAAGQPTAHGFTEAFLSMSAFSILAHDVHAFDHPAEHGVLAVELGRRRVVM